ncbi:MAG: Asp-tRNA(Asn)/Glu-tRNA(Gln) amidotransferase subunit GatC [Candidatus Methanoplasma sp.]|jgi:aspartyl-tRNA(Asn)/glutamyl-tRNA(Gln) amidotransferase subunit C|nr:Asp-tRNA(Asn)/Glu-tRNA(Gln) amidotransferase subunit GatC [Candidatus Methanoplasma sp.]
MDLETVARVARAARISLTEEEAERYRRDLTDILDYFKVLDEAPDGSSAGVNPVEVADALRDDEPRVCADAYAMLSGMKTYDGYVRGPRLS